jgi:hypothetical protein
MANDVRSHFDFLLNLRPLSFVVQLLYCSSATFSIRSTALPSSGFLDSDMTHTGGFAISFLLCFIQL